MADKPVHEVVGVDAVLDGLSSPTSSDVFEAVDLFSSKAVAAVAAQRALAGGGGSSPFLTTTVTLTHADILALGSGQFELVAPTEILGYAAEPTSLPYPLMCNGWLLNPNGTLWGNLHNPDYLDICWGSDYSATVGRAVEWNARDTPPTLQNYHPFNNQNWNISFVIAPDPFGGAAYQDNGLYVSLNLNGNDGDLTGGDPAATLTLTTIYYISQRPT